MFHNEITKIYSELEAIVDKLATDSQRGSYTLKKLNCRSQSHVFSRCYNFTLILATPNNVQSSTIKSGHEISNSAINKYPAPITNGNSATNGGKFQLNKCQERKKNHFCCSCSIDSFNRDKKKYFFVLHTGRNLTLQSHKSESNLSSCLCLLTYV